MAAYLTLHHCLTTVARLLAPFTPFISEAIWQNLAAGRDGAPESVHLAEYPEPEPAAVDPELDEAMQRVRDVVALGRMVRNRHRVRVRQPLASAQVYVPGDRARWEPLRDLVEEELNVKRVEFVEEPDQVTRWRAKPNYRLLGPRLGPRVKEVAARLDADDGTLAARLARGESVSVTVGGVEVPLAPTEVDLVRETREGWEVASEGGIAVALDLRVGPELRREGLAREVVRAVQDARKAAGLEVSDRIELGLDTSGQVHDAVVAFQDSIAAEALAVRLQPAPLPQALHTERREVEGVELTITLRRA